MLRSVISELSDVARVLTGAMYFHQVDGKKVRGRRYPWGVVQIENMEHSDFIPLRNMLVSVAWNRGMLRLF